MNPWLAFWLGTLTGSAAMLFILALCAAAARGDEQAEAARRSDEQQRWDRWNA